MSGVGRFIRKRRAKRAAFMADPAISNSRRSTNGTATDRHNAGPEGKRTDSPTGPFVFCMHSHKPQNGRGFSPRVSELRLARQRQYGT